jgi:hypothetical protein
MEVTMRRKDLVLSEEEAWEIMRDSEFGFLATVGADGSPYGVVLSHAAAQGHIYFHCAMDGHKLDNIRANPQVCYTAVSVHQVLPAKMSAYYRSAAAFGIARILTEDQEKRQALRLLMDKYSPGYICKALENPAPDMRTCVFAIHVEKITGKRSADTPDTP